MKGPVSHDGYTERYKYQEFIKRYLREEGITYSNWKEIQPLYLRYRARCLKMQPENYEQFLNLCTFESTRANTKYDMHANLLEGKHRIHFCKKDQKRKYRDIQGTGQQARANYKLNYKDWSYLKYALADYEAVKSLIEEFENGQHTAAVGDNNQYYYQYPYLVRYALKCLGGTIPAECFPEPLNSYKEELQELLNKQKEAYSKSESETILNDLTKYLEGDENESR